MAILQFGHIASWPFYNFLLFLDNATDTGERFCTVVDDNVKLEYEEDMEEEDIIDVEDLSVVNDENVVPLRVEAPASRSSSKITWRIGNAKVHEVKRMSKELVPSQICSGVPNSVANVKDLGYFSRLKQTDCAALLCGHIFHGDCIEEWFKHTETPTCPNCRAHTATNQVVRRLFFSASDDTTLVDELMKTLSEKKYAFSRAQAELRGLKKTLSEKKNAFSRAQAELRGLKNDYKNLENKLALELVEKSQLLERVVLLRSQNDIQIKQLDEAKNLQKKLKAKLHEERKQLTELRKKKSDFEAQIKSMEEQTRVSMKKENNLEKLVKSMEKQLKIYKKKESDFGEPVKSLEGAAQIPEGKKQF
ncbi:unnamed protein product [Cylicocyclus nassatus]|uniref:RING-type domain-containing protein n=1 Tax=Cylicocyclus nassatus TaxID=53992 RepID=A0AA36GQE9_CYLNA|nr:unnamed protein product [Cylicocyclus nassatus]